MSEGGQPLHTATAVTAARPEPCAHPSASPARTASGSSPAHGPPARLLTVCTCPTRQGPSPPHPAGLVRLGRSSRRKGLAARQELRVSCKQHLRVRHRPGCERES